MDETKPRLVLREIDPRVPAFLDGLNRAMREAGITRDGGVVLQALAYAMTQVIVMTDGSDDDIEGLCQMIRANLPLVREGLAQAATARADTPTNAKGGDA